MSAPDRLDCRRPVETQSAIVIKEVLTLLRLTLTSTFDVEVDIHRLGTLEREKIDDKKVTIAPTQQLCDWGMIHGGAPELQYQGRRTAREQHDPTRPGPNRAAERSRCS